MINTNFSQLTELANALSINIPYDAPDNPYYHPASTLAEKDVTDSQIQEVSRLFFLAGLLNIELGRSSSANVDRFIYLLAGRIVYTRLEDAVIPKAFDGAYERNVQILAIFQEHYPKALFRDAAESLLKGKKLRLTYYKIHANSITSEERKLQWMEANLYDKAADSMDFFQYCIEMQTRMDERSLSEPELKIGRGRYLYHKVLPKLSKNEVLQNTSKFFEVYGSYLTNEDYFIPKIFRQSLNNKTKGALKLIDVFTTVFRQKIEKKVI